MPSVSYDVFSDPSREYVQAGPCTSTAEEPARNIRVGCRHYNRQALVEELRRRYDRSEAGHLRNRFRFVCKSYLWLGIVAGATAAKRFLDVLLSAFLLVAASPAFGLVALAIKLTDGGRVLFWQKRVGQWGREFEFPKFRSMVVNAERLKAQLLAQNDHKASLTFKMKKDPRVTWIGRILRKFSIDELPQLWCVLKGDMSLVGPRPPLTREVEGYSLSDRRRLDAKPGLTCFWQVDGRGDIPFDQQVELDLRYIDSQSIRIDILLLLRTIPAVLTGRGAY